jgi:DNA mismatch endonuclease (patch repair protein)
MGRIRAKNTSTELAVRSCVHRLGLRFRLHDKRLPGSPDLVLPRHRTVIFVHGCFGHRHPQCLLAYVPKSGITFWEDKFRLNQLSDLRARSLLECSGWRVLVIWECETRASGFEARLREVLP